MPLDTNTQPYASVSDFLARYDRRTIGDLVSDTDDRETNLDNHPVLLSALSDASGIVEAYCLAGGRYHSEDLASMTGNAASLLKRLVCDIAYLLLKDRRGYILDDYHREIYGRVSSTLEKLRNGEMIFGFTKTQKAGVARVSEKSPMTIRTISPLATDFARRVFGIRSLYIIP
jgi:phage gp36-like protein